LIVRTYVVTITARIHRSLALYCRIWVNLKKNDELSKIESCDMRVEQGLVNTRKKK